ncbi:MAG TPA: DUF1656 domain-containing protein [Acetobacteraceae bacterium]|nr:DUF1656 domain-containing protein [Acetobacteraceae bacterium]
MIHEVDFYGLLVSPMLIWAAIALPVSALLRRLIGRAGLYRFVWHRPLFDFALLIIVLGGVVGIISHWNLP